VNLLKVKANGKSNVSYNNHLYVDIDKQFLKQNFYHMGYIKETTNSIIISMNS
jgi:hypothetical protein